MQFRFLRITDAKDYILAALLLVFAGYLMVTRHDGGMQNLRKLSVTMLSYLEQPLANIRIYRQALKTNSYLQRQNVLLQDELSKMRSAAQQNEILRELLDMRERSEYPLVPVMVVAKDLTGLNNSITVNAGTLSDVEPGMPFVTPDGLAGQVIISSKNYSQVIPYSNAIFNVSARIQGSRALGIISWTGSSHDELIMQHVPQTIPVETGQIVETSGYSNQFPPGIPIGEITAVEPQEGMDVQVIRLKPFVNLFTAAEGFIMKFRPDSTIQNLIENQEELF